MLAHKVRKLAPPEYVVKGYDLPEFNITDRSMVYAEIQAFQPDVVVNCAAYTNVDGCETEEGLATCINGVGPGYLAEAARQVGAVLVHISTDYVFDGRKQSPYLETDIAVPLSAYGRSKLAGEQAIIASGLERFFIIRSSWLYGPNGKNFVETIIRLANEREELRIVADQIGAPTYTGDLADAIFNLLALNANPQSPTLSSYGLYHFANAGQCSWYEFAVEIVRLLKEQGSQAKVQRITPISTKDYPLPALRPAWSVFSKEKYLVATGAVVPDWRQSLATYMESRTI